MPVDITPLPFEKQTLPAMLAERRALGERVFIRGSGRQLSYEEAQQLAGRYAGKFRQAGIEKGDRIVVFWSNRMELLYAWLGAMWMGAILVPVNTAFRGEQLRNLLQIARPALVLSEAGLLQYLDEVGNALQSAHHIWVTDADGKLPERIGNCTVSAWTEDGSYIEASPVVPSDPAAILYTSGTSGPSKAVVCPHAQFYWWGVLNARYMGITGEDVLHTVLPMFHTNALNTLWQALVTGATYAFFPRFSASRFWEQVRDSGATVTYLLGAMIFILLKSPPRSGDRAHNVRIALSPSTAPALIEEFHRRFGVQLVEGYGSTETNLVFSNVLDRIIPGAMGRPDENFEVRIVDENDCEVAQGMPGELIIRGRQPFSMASGYFGDPEATVKAWRNLWFHTGDLVRCDADGIYHFLDRLKESIRRRGENISSCEVEQALLMHEQIENAAVVGVPSEMGEEDVMAYIVPRQGADCDPMEITRFLEKRLAHFAIPRYMLFVPELPQTENGKVKKFVLKQAGIRPDAWDRERAVGSTGS